MEEQMTGAQVSQDVNAGTSESLVSGEELFSKYEEGASLEELNAMLANSSADEPEQVAEDKPEPEGQGEELQDTASRATVQDNGGPEAPAGALGKRKGGVTDELVAANSGQGGSGARPDAERLFTQKDVDYIIGKKTSEDRRIHSALLDDLSAILGVERDKVVNEIRKQRLETEAEKQGVTDKELYAEKRQLEEQNAAMMQAQQMEAARQACFDELQRQERETGISLEKLSDNEPFVTAVNLFYGNPATRQNAVRMAYNAVFFDDAVKNAAQQERERVISSVKAGAARVQEGAANAGSAAAAKIDVGKLSDEQIADMASRVMNGERVTL